MCFLSVMKNGVDGMVNTCIHIHRPRLQRQLQKKLKKVKNYWSFKIKTQCTTLTLTLKSELVGEILSSANTQIPLVSLSDMYSMSWPSTLRLAIVNTLLFFSFCETVSKNRVTIVRVTFVRRRITRTIDMLCTRQNLVKEQWEEDDYYTASCFCTHFRNQSLHSTTVFRL